MRSSKSTSPSRSLALCHASAKARPDSSCGARNPARSSRAARVRTAATASAMACWLSGKDGSAFSAPPILRGVPSFLSSVSRKPASVARRASASPRSQPSMKSAAAWPVFADHARVAASQARSVEMGKASSEHASATQASSASAGMPSRRCTRGAIGGCQLPGPSHKSICRAQRISQPRTASGPLRLLISAIAPATRGSPSARRSARTSRLNKSRSRSSIGREPGMIPASPGKAARRYCAKAWIVSMRSPPPGQSSTRAKRERARACVAGSIGAPR